jgi:hypothetical protein
VSNDSDDLSSKTKTVADPWGGAVDHAHAAEAALGGQDDLFGPGGVIDIQSHARIAEIIDKKSQPTISELLSGSTWVTDASAPPRGAGLFPGHCLLEFG